jgi:hypothetical protein
MTMHVNQQRRIGRILYRHYCAGATWTEMQRWYGRYGLTEPLMWRLMALGMKRGARCRWMPDAAM